MNLYEGMFIFPESMKEEALDAAVSRARGEIEKLGGRTESATRIGKRSFARPMAKQTSGHYVVIVFRLDGGQLGALKEKYRLSGEVFRLQVVRAEAAPAAAEAAGGGKGGKASEKEPQKAGA